MPTPVTNPAPLIAQAFRLANQLATEDLENEGHPVLIDGQRWWDTRPMLDANRHPPSVVADLVESINYGLSADLFEAHPNPTQAHLVRVATTHQVPHHHV